MADQDAQKSSIFTFFRMMRESYDPAVVVEAFREMGFQPDGVPAVAVVPMSKLPPALYHHAALGDMFDRFQMHQYAMKYLMECEAAAAASLAGEAGTNELAVWFGSMPESNGKTNWTAILHRGDIAEGHTIERSEYHDRVRYEADCVRYLIGELPERPDILSYDPELRVPASTGESVRPQEPLPYAASVAFPARLQPEKRAGEIPGCNRGNLCPWGEESAPDWRAICGACGRRAQGSGQ